VQFAKSSRAGGCCLYPVNTLRAIPLMLLERMGLTPADLAAVPQHRPEVPTFAEYVPVVSVAVSAGTRRAYGSYWHRVVWSSPVGSPSGILGPEHCRCTTPRE
jgi:hypothetical protein